MSWKDKFPKENRYWESENGILYCGDCLEIMKNFPENSIDLVLTDPPYGVNYGNKNKFLNSINKGNRIQEDIIGDNLDKISTQKLWGNSFKLIGKLMKNGAVIYCFMPQGGDQMMMMMMMMMNEGGIEPRHELIWLKNNHVLGRVDYAYIHEPILYAWKGTGHKFYGGFQKSVISVKRPNKNSLHPTMKPVELISLLIRNSSKKDDLVFDPFFGSGTTGVACEKLGRRWIGIEILEKYCEIAKHRIKAEADQLKFWR